MRLFESITPRRDVLEGALTESRFAASLEEVVAGTAPEAYGRQVRSSRPHIRPAG